MRQSLHRPPDPSSRRCSKRVSRGGGNHNANISARRLAGLLLLVHDTVRTIHGRLGLRSKDTSRGRCRVRHAPEHCASAGIDRQDWQGAATGQPGHGS